MSTDWWGLIGGMLELATKGVSFGKELVEFKNALAGQGHNPQMWQTMPGAPVGWSPVSMQPFAPKMPDPFGGGNQWLPQLQNVAAQFGNPWVPAQTSGFLGIDLTGIWAPPLNPFDQTYFRQFGPYLNIVVGLAGMPAAFGEGIFAPHQAAVCLMGQYVTGAPLLARAQLFPNWTMQGAIASVNQFGMPLQLPLFMAKMT